MRKLSVVRLMYEAECPCISEDAVREMMGRLPPDTFSGFDIRDFEIPHLVAGGKAVVDPKTLEMLPRDSSEYVLTVSPIPVNGVSVPGRVAFVHQDGKTRLDRYVHELGHMLGLHHHPLPLLPYDLVVLKQVFWGYDGGHVPESAIPGTYRCAMGFGNYGPLGPALCGIHSQILRGRPRELAAEWSPPVSMPKPK